VLIGLVTWFFMQGTPSSPPPLPGGKAAEVQVPHSQTQPVEDLPVPLQLLLRFPHESTADHWTPNWPRFLEGYGVPIKKRISPSF